MRDLATQLATTFSPTLIIFPEDHAKTPYGDPRPGPGYTGDYHPCPVELVLDNFWLFGGGHRLVNPGAIREGRPNAFTSEKEWLFSLVQQKADLSEGVINLTGLEVDEPSTAWDSYFSIISSSVSRQDEGHPYPLVIYARVISSQDVTSAGNQLPQIFGVDYLAVQYWMFYYYNHWWNLHEMDWEMITIIVRPMENSGWEPVKVGYSAHSSGHSREWDQVHRNLSDHNSPLVFVAAGSHAAYFEFREGGYSTVARKVRHISWLSRLIRKITFQNGFEILTNLVDIVPCTQKVVYLENWSASLFVSLSVKSSPSALPTISTKSPDGCIS